MMWCRLGNRMRRISFVIGILEFCSEFRRTGIFVVSATLRTQGIDRTHSRHFQADWKCFEGDRVLFNIPGLCVPRSSEFQIHVLGS